MTEETAERIASALERIAAALEGGARAEPARKKAAVPQNDCHAVLKAYCDTYRARWGSSPPITKAAAGQIQQLLKSQSAPRLTQLLQAYVQMEDPVFRARGYDLGTFVLHLNRISLALANGTRDPYERDEHAQIFGENHGKNDVHRRDEAILGNLGQPALPSGAPGDLLEGPQPSFGF